MGKLKPASEVNDCSIKKGLVDLEYNGAFTLNKLQQLVELDPKLSNIQGHQKEDHILWAPYKLLEAEISTLQISVVYRQGENLGDGLLKDGPYHFPIVNSSPTPMLENSSSCHSDGVTLWSSLESKYASLLKLLVTDSVNDSMRVAACEAWEEELVDWDNFIGNFEQFVDTLAWDDTMGMKQSESFLQTEDGKLIPIDVKNTTEDAPTVLNVLPADHRLLINMLRRPDSIASRGQEAVSELVNLSCSVLQVPSDAIAACREIWEILIMMCGKEPKICSSHNAEHAVDTLRAVLFNVIRCLQDICCKQILRQLRLPEKSISEESFLEKIKSFCSLDHSVRHRPDITYYLKLIYWCVRSGSCESLKRLVQSLEYKEEASSYLSDNDTRILIALSILLHERLQLYSRHHRLNEDMVCHPTLQMGLDTSVWYREDKITVTQLVELLQRRNDLTSHPIITLLMSLLQPDGVVVGFKNLMPNASAEDFLWCNLCLLENKPPSRLAKSVLDLQKRVISLGPSYFGSADTTSKYNLAFAKIACLVMAPTVAIDWISQAYSELTVICVQWLFYLAQCGFTGGLMADAFIPTLFPHLDKFLGSESLTTGFEELIAPSGKLTVMSLKACLQWCEILPRPLRTPVISSLIHAGTSELLEDSELRSYVIGSIQTDGSCSAGLLFRCLSVSSYMDDIQTEDTQNNVMQVFETLVAGVAEAAVQKHKFLQAVGLSYMISQDRAAMKLLLHLFTLPYVFPHVVVNDAPSRDTVTQNGAFMFFNIFENRINNGELIELVTTFELLTYAKHVADCFNLAYEQSWKKCWERITATLPNQEIGSNSGNSLSQQTGLTLFPDSRLIHAWSNTTLVTLLPRLIEVCAKCAEILPYKENQYRIPILLKSCQELHDASSSVPSYVVQRLKRLLDKPNMT